MFNITFPLILMVILGVVVIVSAAKVLEIVLLLLGRLLRFLLHMVRDALRLLGHCASFVVLIPLAVLNLLMLNRARMADYSRSMVAEISGLLMCLWRLAAGNLLEIFGLDPLNPATNKVEPLPLSTPRSGFDGYRIVGNLPGGGSGAKLYVAEPSFQKSAQLREAGFPPVDKVVLKSFALSGGPTLPQIMRENQSLEVAKRLGFVLEHGTDEKHFWYAMPYVPGDNLAVVSNRMHASSSDGSLTVPELRRGLGYISDLLLALERFHLGGLWHKDVKPENVVVCGERAFLVDLGLVTSLSSSATLTTHGTEYFRDPELVRMAMQGTKVNEVEAVKFDIYGAGAVLYSVIEGSFPAHGGLSQITKKCPEALKWVVRRAMAEVNGRYSSSREMLLDLHKVNEADDPFALRPADLPSMGGSLPHGIGNEVPELKQYRPLRSEPGIASMSARNGALATIEILGGPQHGKLFPLRAGKYILGRSSRCDITLEGSAISNRHLQIVVANDGTVRFRDLASRNGTWYGAVKKSKGEWHVGSELKLGAIGLGLHSSLAPGETESYQTVTGASPNKKIMLGFAVLVALFLFKFVGFDDVHLGSCSRITFSNNQQVHLATIPGSTHLQWGDVQIWSREDVVRPAGWSGPRLFVIDEISAFGAEDLRIVMGALRHSLSEVMALSGAWGEDDAQRVDLQAKLLAVSGARGPKQSVDEIGDMLVADGQESGLIWLRPSAEDNRVDVFLLKVGSEYEDEILESLNLD